ncbi:MAG: hypothetical protein R2684_13135 [Pyrinomonadaceae bacterium]
MADLFHVPHKSAWGVGKNDQSRVFPREVASQVVSKLLQQGLPAEGKRLN